MAWLQSVWQWVARTFELNEVSAGLLLALLLYRLWVMRQAPEPSRPSVRARTIAAGNADRIADRADSIDAGVWLVMVLYLLVRPYVGTIVEVTTPAMGPTLQGSPTPQIDGPNDRVAVCRYLYHLRAPRRGEIVAWRDLGQPAGPLRLGRLVALAGDEIRLDQSGHVHVNDSFVADAADLEKSPGAPAEKVPDGLVLVLGEPPSGAANEARWHIDGYLPTEQLEGKASAVVWPPDRIRLLD